MNAADVTDVTDGLGRALADALDTYTGANPNSAQLAEQAAHALPGGNTRSVLFYAPFPLQMLRGEGCRLWDADEHGYIDALGEFTAGLYGHSHPVIRDAISGALAQGLSLSAHTPREGQLAAELQGRFPALELLRFTNSGTEANLMALALAAVHTGRRQFIVFDGAYHGGVLAFAGGGSPVNVPHDFLVAPYNDLPALRELMRTNAGQVAGILVEPMLGSGGCIPGTADFLQGLRQLADDDGALLILDEVMTSRLSAGGRQSLLGLRPDLMTLGKYFGGGLSFGAFGGRADIMGRFDPRRPDALAHAGTFNNNVLSMTAGLAGLQQVLTPQALAGLNERGEGLRARLNGVFQQHGVGLQYSGLGSLMQLHATDAPLLRPADAARGDERIKALLFFALVARGIYTARRGLVALSLPWGDVECDAFVQALDDAVATHKAVLPASARLGS